MQVEPFQRGDMNALGDAVDSCLVRMWRLTRRGFLTSNDGVPMYVRGVDDLDATEEAVEYLIAACLDPDRRRRIDSAEAFDRALLAEARTRLTTRAERSGTLVDAATTEALAAVPSSVQDLDRLIAGDEPITEDDVPPDVERQEEAIALKMIRDDYVGQLDERSEDLVQRRFVGAESRAAIAAAWTCGIAAVTERENRVRRKLSHAIRRVYPEQRLGKATIDALLAGRLLAPVPPAPTIDRLRTNVLRRIHIDPPRPFAKRAMWAGGMSAIAFAVWLLMFLGVLPYYDSDTFPTPDVRAVCEGACVPGQTARFLVTAPRDATEVAILTTNDSGAVTPVVVSPTNTSFGLPFGASQAQSPIPYTGLLPKGAIAVVAVFTEQRLQLPLLLEAGRGGVVMDGVVTATAALR